LSPFKERLEILCRRIAKARSPEASHSRPVTLIAVSKTHPPEAIVPLLEAGHRDFGENRVQEALDKWPALKERYPDVRLHLIGSLQSNKAKDAMKLFDVIHTLDRESLIDAIAGIDGAREKTFFLQVNTGEEPQKGGAAPSGLDALLERCRDTRLNVTGLMCIPPADEPPAPHFAFLTTLARDHKLGGLSMGMSGDFETAIRLGATHVRLGTAIFGERE
jgi:PLP dependent protein